jgi:hypothetical protein
MKVFEYIDRINLMHKLINEHRTGNPDDFAARLGIRRTRLYEVIDELKSRDAPILYSKSGNTFYYQTPFDIKIICIMKPLAELEMNEIDGGSFFLQSFFSRYCFITLANC